MFSKEIIQICVLFVSYVSNKTILGEFGKNFKLEDDYIFILCNSVLIWPNTLHALPAAMTASVTINVTKATWQGIINDWNSYSKYGECSK